MVRPIARSTPLAMTKRLRLGRNDDPPLSAMRAGEPTPFPIPPRLSVDLSGAPNVDQPGEVVSKMRMGGSMGVRVGRNGGETKLSCIV